MSVWIFTALLMGIAGSVHCAGMCGPIALVVFGQPQQNKLAGVLTYNAGRIVSYAVLGALSGLAGQSLLWFAGQQWLSVIAGAIILISVLVVYSRWSGMSRVTGALTEKLRGLLKRVMQNRKPTTLLYMGALNGLLPCGLVYAALGGAAGTGSFYTGALFMVLFGLATVPVLLGISLAGAKISPALYRKMVKLVPVSMALIGVLLIIRGLGLGIPYLSPAIECGQMACCHAGN